MSKISIGWVAQWESSRSTFLGLQVQIQARSDQFCPAQVHLIHLNLFNFNCKIHSNSTLWKIVYVSIGEGACEALIGSTYTYENRAIKLTCFLILIMFVLSIYYYVVDFLVDYIKSLVLYSIHRSNRIMNQVLHVLYIYLLSLLTYCFSFSHTDL